MAILNFGSLNIDHVYRLDRFVLPGETLACDDYRRLCGGKGLNQSVAAARAGALVRHVGCIGADGEFLLTALRDCAVDTHLVRTVDQPTGHAIIQVEASGENEIIIFGGANQAISGKHIATALESAVPDDWVLLQNEVNAVGDTIAAAAERKLRIAFNPAPYDERLDTGPLELVDLLIVNQTEGAGLSGRQRPDQILAALSRRFPQAELVLTLGASGALYCSAGATGTLEVKPPPVRALDTTAAGDTFVGFFLAARIAGMTAAAALARACRAAALATTRVGAMQSVPTESELASFYAD